MAVLSNNISVIDQSYVQYVNEYYQYVIFIVSDRTANSLQPRLMEGVLSELVSNNWTGYSNNWICFTTISVGDGSIIVKACGTVKSLPLNLFICFI